MHLASVRAGVPLHHRRRLAYSDSTLLKYGVPGKIPLSDTIMGRGLQNPFQYCALFIQGNPPAASRTFSKSKKITRAAELQLVLLLFLLWTAPAPVVELPAPSVADGDTEHQARASALYGRS